eukprot:Clim_evm10s216 gene=Clim_evmTU10s216
MTIPSSGVGYSSTSKKTRNCSQKQIPLTWGTTQPIMVDASQGDGLGGLPEKFIIELQGSIETQKSDLSGMDLGTLTMNNETGKPEMVIGHHQLLGEYVNLPKQMHVMRKIKRRDPDNGTVTVEYEIMAVVKQKIMFKHRPRPIIEL